MKTVELDQNNSGGDYWLSQEQMDALVADGWRLEEGYEQRYGPRTRGGTIGAGLLLDVPVDDIDHAITIAKIEFERVTGQDPDAIGCTCCGPPFSFHEEW